MSTLSVIIITKNAADDIGNCLESIKWADEIIIFDAGSTDDTVAICRQYTDKIFITDWPGFGIQKNRALAQASQEWVLSIDADEWLSDALKKEIKETLLTATYEAYSMLRLSKFCGRWIRYGSWHNDRVTRLFKRNSGKFSDSIVHERFICSGTLGNLSAPLLHNPFKTLTEVINKMNSYSTAGATMKLANHKRSGLTTALLHGIWTFFKCYFLQRGFLDGREGFILAVSNAEGSYYRYLKLMYLISDKP